MDDLLKQVITIESVETSTTKVGTSMFKIKTMEGLTFNLFKTKKDGGTTKAYEGYAQLGADPVGVSVEVAYKESHYQSDGVDRMSRNIMMMSAGTTGSVPKPMSQGDNDLSFLTGRVKKLEDIIYAKFPDESTTAADQMRSAMPAGVVEELVPILPLDDQQAEAPQLTPDNIYPF